MKQLLLLILLLLGNQCYPQSTEMVGSEIFGYRLSDAVNGNYNVVRTDEDGKVVWVKPVITDNNIPFDLSENQYIIYGFTEVKNGKIINDPSEYDYWLVITDTTYDISVYPNPTSTTFYVALSNYNDGISINLYDIAHRLVFNNQITQYINFFNLPYLSNGTYIYEIITTNKILKTGKLCVLQNY
jgi:hypothetical protein